MPAEQHGSGKQHDPSVGSCKHGRGDEIECGIGVEEGVAWLIECPSVALRQAAQHWADDAEAADAVEQDTCHKPVEGIVGVALLLVQLFVHLVDAPREVELGAYHSANRYAENKEYGKFTFHHVWQGSVSSKH